ncbi:general secretion pathway protein GspH [Vibrio cholerae]|nr:general secretion pathway protein GspH [Vibrio cholerae]PAS19715.1 general secretion pathway protein GspH [Vibrio cholerae]
MPDEYLVESVGSSEVSKPLKANNSRCFNVVGCSTLAAWFHKK